jgi:hypothetical protein
MWYIVWQEPYERYRKPQGDGYFVGYKNKIEDNFSKNWFEAKKYKSFGSAIERMGLRMNSTMVDSESFCQGNLLDKESVRDFKLDKLLGETPNIRNFIFGRGRIDKIDEGGNFCGSAVDEVVEWVERSIRGNIASRESKNRKLEKLGLKPNDPQVDTSTEEYLEDFMDFFN